MPSHGQRIEVYDTTLRDGAQTEGISLSVEDKLATAEALDKLGVDYIEGGYPLSNPKDQAFFEQIRSRGLTHAKIVGFGMTRRKGVAAAEDAGLAALLAAGTPVVALVGKSWDLHVREVLRTDADENLAMIADSVRYCVDAGREVVFDAEHFFDGWRANPDYAIRTLRAASEAGASCLALCDTNGGSLPEQIAEGVAAARDALPDAPLAIHCHDDAGVGVANTLAAVRSGAVQVQGTLNGVGERCGNADLTAVVANLALKYGYDVLRAGTLEHLTETNRYFCELANLNLRQNQPFVGPGAFAHKGGMHVHAVQQNARTYEHIAPEQVGNTRRVLVSELSGLSTIAANAPAKFNLAEDKDAQRRVLDRLAELEGDGWQFEAAEASFEVLIRKTLGGTWYRPLWDLDHYRCVIFKHDGTEAGTEGIVKLRVDGELGHTVAEGHGPVDSLHRALCAALRCHYPAVDALHLVDYKVRVVNTAAETAAKVRVMIDWHDESGHGYFGSVGVSENIIEASWLALVDAVEYKLLCELDAEDA